MPLHLMPTHKPYASTTTPQTFLPPMSVAPMYIMVEETMEEVDGAASPMVEVDMMVLVITLLINL